MEHQTKFLHPLLPMVYPTFSNILPKLWNVEPEKSLFTDNRSLCASPLHNQKFEVEHFSEQYELRQPNATGIPIPFVVQSQIQFSEFKVQIYISFFVNMGFFLLPQWGVEQEQQKKLWIDSVCIVTQYAGSHAVYENWISPLKFLVVFVVMCDSFFIMTRTSSLIISSQHNPGPPTRGYIEPRLGRTYRLEIQTIKPN